MEKIPFSRVYDFIRPGESMLYGLKTRDRCIDHWDLLARVMHLKGDLIEVGVWRGGTAALAAAQMVNFGSEDMLFMCDTWSGILKSQVTSKDIYRGSEHSDASERDVVELFERLGLLEIEAELLSGEFPKVTGCMIQGHEFKYVSLDVDIYEATKECFEFLWPRVVPGGVVIIDDYGWQNTPGVTAFVDELVNSPLRKEFSITGDAKYQFSIIKDIKDI